MDVMYPPVCMALVLKNCNVAICNLHWWPLKTQAIALALADPGNEQNRGPERRQLNHFTSYFRGFSMSGFSAKKHRKAGAERRPFSLPDISSSATSGTTACCKAEREKAFKPAGNRLQTARPGTKAAGLTS
jgi:hypothetical protein